MDWEIEYYKVSFRKNGRDNWTTTFADTEDRAVEIAKNFHIDNYQVKVEKVLKMILNF